MTPNTPSPQEKPTVTECIEWLQFGLDNPETRIRMDSGMAYRYFSAAIEHLRASQAPASAALLEALLERLQADGGKYLLSVALTTEERRAMPEPTYGGKGHSRWLTEEEHAALCSMLAATLRLHAEGVKT
jgi:hypothetical protein